MVKNIFIGGILFFAAIMQVSLFSNFFPMSLAPDMAMLVIIIWTIKSDFNIVLKWAILGGFFSDMLLFWPVGTSIFSFVAVAFITNSLGKRFLVSQVAWKYLIFALIVAVATLLNYIVVLTSIKILTNQEIISRGIFSYMELLFRKEMLLKILHNLIMFAMIYWPLGKINKVFAYYNKK